MRLLLISAAYPPAPGGVATHVAELAHGLVQSAHNVVVLTLSKDDKFKRSGDNRLVILKLPFRLEPTFHAQGLYGENVLTAGLHNWHLIRADIIHAHDPDSLFIGWMLKTVHRIPLVYTSHRAPSPWRQHRFLESPKDCFMETMKRVHAIDGIAVPSESSAQVLRQQGFEGGNRPQKIEIVPHGISQFLRSETDDPAITEWILSNKGTARLIYCPSRPDVHKDVDTFLEAAEILKQQYGGGAVVFVMGCAPEGDAYEKLKARAIALGLKEGVDLHLRQFLYKEMASVYRRADVCVVPSRHESFGLTVLEAFLFDVPVVAANATALAEVVTNDHSGLLFSPGDPNDLARQTSRILEDETLRQRLTDNGRRMLRQGDKYDATTMIRAYERFYERVLSDSHEK